MTNLFSVSIGLAFMLMGPVFDSSRYDASPKFKITKNLSPSYITEWETSSSWDKSNSTIGKTFEIKRSFSQLTNQIINKGVVLVFVKGYDFNQVKANLKPIPLPFYMFSSDDNENASFAWSIQSIAGQVKIGLHIPSAMEGYFDQNKGSIQFRYFIIPETILKKHKLSASAIHNMNYQQVVQLLSVKP